MMKSRTILLLAATMMLIGCRAAARHTTAWAQDRMTLTQSTFRAPDVVPERLAEEVIADAPELSLIESSLLAEAAVDAETAEPPRQRDFLGAAAPAVRPAGGCAGEVLDVAIEHRVEWRRTTKAS